MPSGRRCSNFSSPPCASTRAGGAQVVAVHREDVDGVKLNLVIEFAGMERVEIGDAVNAKNDRLTIEDELLVSVLQRGLDDLGITLHYQGTMD
jgi:hypothetical protein